VAVLHDEVLVEEAEGLLRRGRREADERGVEVLEDLAPEGVDRPVALVDEDDVEGLDGDRGVVGDRDRLGDEPATRRELRALLERGVEVRLAPE
jgi:hypothetical protein